ncbi:MAG: TonB-dependent receptor, partial [Pedobacter sp.]
MKQALLSVIIICFNFVAFAQIATLSGRITNINGQAMDGATVSIKELHRNTMTDEKGRYEFKGLKFGSYTILITSVVAETKIQMVTINTANQTFNAKVKEKVDRDLQEVSVSGKTEKRKMETSGFAMSIIETKEASLRNLTTNELLDRAVGVRVRQNGGEGAPIEYNLNGMSGSTIGIFLDGIEISTYGSSFNLNNIPPSMIERIEVYKGVLPSHLSGNYIGGAINVIMKKDASANNITAAVSYGSFNTYRADIGALYRNDKNGFTARASGFYSHSDNNYEMWGKFSKYTLPGGRIVRNYRIKRPN